MSDSNVEDFLEHFGVPGMKWGQRRAGKKMAKVAQRKQFVDTVMKDVGSRNMNELYAVGSKHRTTLMTGREFLGNVKMQQKMTSLNSTGLMFDTSKKSSTKQKTRSKTVKRGTQYAR